MQVSEIVGMEGDIITMQDIFVFDYNMGYDDNGHALGTLKSTGLRPKFLDKLSAHGIHVDPTIFAFEKFAK
jgi:pilus assembly protein CpaF